MDAAASHRRGLLPWLIWGLGALFYCYAFFQRVAPSVMVGELMRDFAVGATITGVLSALYFYAYAGLQIPVGLLLDRFGPRKMVTWAAGLSALGSIAFASADGLTPAYFGRLLIGLGASVSWVGALKLAAAWFPPQRFALLTGLTMAMGMAGAIGAQAPLSASVAAFGWRGTLMGAAGFAALLAIACWMIVRDHPQDMRSAAPAPQTADFGMMKQLLSVLKEPQTYLCGGFGALLAATPLAFAGLWGVPYMMQTYGIDRPAAALSTSVMLAGWGVGAPLVGWITDRVGSRKIPMLAVSSSALLCCMGWLYLPGLSLPAVYALFLAHGLASGGIVLCFATAREHNFAWAGGAALGVVNMMMMSTGAIFQPLVGWVLDRAWDGRLIDGARVYAPDAYIQALTVLVACQCGSLLCAIFVRETHCKPAK